MSKKGISIGAALRNRMETSESDEDKTIIEKGVRASSVSTPPVEEVEVVSVPGAGQAQAQTTGDPLESFNTRLRRSVQRRLKVYSALNNVKIQDVVAEALENYLNDKRD